MRLKKKHKVFTNFKGMTRMLEVALIKCINININHGNCTELQLLYPLQFSG